MSVKKDEFLNRKKDLVSTSSHFPNVGRDISNTERSEKIADRNLYFDKNNNQMIRYPKGFWEYNEG
jgi:hypothetical protein